MVVGGNDTLYWCFKRLKDSMHRKHFSLNVPNLRAPARPRITVTGLFGFVQN